jgi:putative aldouronate transport system permease protein
MGLQLDHPQNRRGGVVVIKTKGERLTLSLNAILIALLCIIMIYPFWYQISLSVSDAIKARQGGAFLMPRGFSLAAYKTVLTSSAMGYGFGNTLFVTIAGTVLSLLITSATAYPLSRKDLPMHKLFTMMVVFTFVFSGGMIPTFLVVRELGLINSHWSLILPVLVASYNVLIMRNFFANIPAEIEESAHIDGAGDIRIFFSLILPLSGPVLATVGLWLAVGYWNNYFNALLYINRREMRVLQQILMEIINSSRADNVLNVENAAGITPETVKAASIMVISIPILCMYPFLQKFFVKGVMVGSVKG